MSIPKDYGTQWKTLPAELRWFLLTNIGDKQDCWLWMGNKISSGYGVLKVKGKHVLAHRFGYELLIGEIEVGQTSDHLCRNRLCVNPFHIEIVSNKENILRGSGPTAKNAVKTHCVHGHLLSGVNLAIEKGEHGNTRRRCKTCQSLSKKRSYPLHKSQIAERGKRYYEKNKDAILSKQRAASAKKRSV